MDVSSICRAPTPHVGDTADPRSAGSTDADAARPAHASVVTVATFHRVAIEAPAGAAALELERRLAHLKPSPAAVCYRGAWIVDVQAVTDLDELDAVVGGWLRDVGFASSVVLVDGSAHIVTAGRSHRATNAAFIG
jgi:hypothetical protein